jgi:hypothetical protein
LALLTARLVLELAIRAAPELTALSSAHFFAARLGGAGKTARGLAIAAFQKILRFAALDRISARSRAFSPASPRASQAVRKSVGSGWRLGQRSRR